MMTFQAMIHQDWSHIPVEVDFFRRVRFARAEHEREKSGGHRGDPRGLRQPIHPFRSPGYDIEADQMPQ